MAVRIHYHLVEELSPLFLVQQFQDNIQKMVCMAYYLIEGTQIIKAYLFSSWHCPKQTSIY